MKTEINIYVLLALLLIHWFADFVLQTHKQATEKSTSNRQLTMHVLVYSGIWMLVCNFYSVLTGNYKIMALFPIITFICHWITDYFTSRLNSYLYKKGDIHNFFVSVGFDQILHYVQLLITFQILSN